MNKHIHTAAIVLFPAAAMQAAAQFSSMGVPVSKPADVSVKYDTLSLLDEEAVYPYYEDDEVDARGGLLLNAGADVALFSRERAAVNPGIGYRYQQVSAAFSEVWDVHTGSRGIITRFNRLQLQIGFIFR